MASTVAVTFMVGITVCASVNASSAGSAAACAFRVLLVSSYTTALSAPPFSSMEMGRFVRRTPAPAAIALAFAPADSTAMPRA